ncbi:hypothetical protein [Marinoscillum sp.]|uniref:hypothetical protein n=1 Tax=Marinoscillum sp. TaxID=2024838 RepID=UPI003BAD56B8
MNNSQMPEWVLDYNIPKRDAFKSLKKFKEERISPGMLRGSHQLLARYLLNFVIENWNQSSYQDRALGFYTSSNCTSLARLCDCTPRSIRNQLMRLIDVGIVLTTEMTGRGLKVYINPEVILFSFDPDRKKDHPLVLEPDLVKNKLTGVDNTTKNSSKNIEEHRVSRDTNDVPYVKRPGTGSISDHAKDFWTFAKRKIYWDRSFSNKRESVILELIEDLLTIKMAQSQKSLWDVYFRQMNYLSYAATWFEKHPEVTPPDPYHFFSYERKGFRFIRIEAWDNQKKINIQMRRTRLSLEKEVKQSSQATLGNGLSRMIVKHGSQIGSFENERLNKWFVYSYPKYLKP